MINENEEWSKNVVKWLNRIENKKRSEKLVWACEKDGQDMDRVRYKGKNPRGRIKIDGSIRKCI